MNTIQIGDKTVSQLGFGAMRITGSGVWGEPADHDNAIAVLQRAVELGINFIDTADAYGPDTSEKLIREALHPYNNILTATKGGLTRPGPGEWVPDCSPKHLRDAILGSLDRLSVAQIELYQLHTVDPNVPFVDSLNTMLELQQQGTIKHLGLSNVEPEHLQQALDAGAKVVSVQNNYSLLNREYEDVLDICRQNDIIFIPYFPIGGNTGGLTEAVLDGIADAHSATPRQIGLAWLLQHYEKMLPIPGTSSLEHLDENVKAADIVLTEDEIMQLNGLAGE